MPACSSDIFASGTRYRSSSPPNSRSSSASPPLSWPIGPGASPMSTSPSHTSSTVKFKRSVSNLSNLSNSSLPRVQTIFSTNHNETSGLTIAENSTAAPHDGHRCRHGAVSRESNETRIANSPTKRIFRAKSNDEKINSTSGKTWFLPARIFVWYVDLVFRLMRRSHETLSYVIWAPLIWISAWICVFWVVIQLPLNLIKWFLRALYTPSFERSRNKRCVLISGGSTIQALHLARNFYRAGARVVVCEIEGLFGLARFSTACSRFYSVPRPGPGTAAEYVNALKTIVAREKVVYFVPVSCTNGAYYDALAKSHLEIMGCECFVPGAAEVTSLEDPLRLIERCESLGLSRPIHRIVRSPDDLVALYENGHFATNGRHVMISAGPAGMTERAKLSLPSSVDNAVPRNLRGKLVNHEISERRPWIIMREPSTTTGCQLVTCTTIKDSRVVANVTCRLDETTGLVPEERDDVDHWLETFFHGLFATRINGHLSFKLAFNAEDSQGLVAMSCRVGVPLPYLCLTSVHPRLVWRPCRHFSRRNSVNHVVNDRYKKSMGLRSASSDGLTAPVRSAIFHDDFTTRNNGSANSRRHFVTPLSPVLDKRDALFVYWDPLPYCAYYHLEFPFRRLAGVIRERPAQHKPPLAVVQ